MNSNLRQLYILLIAAGFDKSKIQDVFISLKEVDLKTFLDDFEELRELIDLRVMPSKKKSNIVIRDNLKSKETKNTNDDIVSRIYNLLVIDSKLSIKNSILLLVKTIGIVFPTRSVPKVNTKNGFSRNVLILGREFSDSELLHVASRLRNELRHENLNDWILKDL